LSGGERNRLLLARLFARPANVLVMDEPTNDLDIDSLELLEQTLQTYGGTLLLVSHDRAFLDNVVTQTLVAEGEGRWQEYVGGYSDWLAYKQSRAAISTVRGKSEAKSSPTPAAAKPVKLSYKENRELELLPMQIDALEQQQQQLVERMSAPDYHRQGPEQMKADNLQASAIERDLADKFERWAALDAKSTGTQ
jgi:ATP-binding cassette subfamily F protein uup